MAAAVNADHFKKLLCDIFLSHVPEIDRYQFYDTENFCKATIGTTFTVCARLWGLLELHHNIREIFVQPKHILWALCSLKVYASQYVLASLLHVDRKSLMRWTWIVVENIHWLHGEVVSSHLFCPLPVLTPSNLDYNEGTL
jgi:hypothetical protein